MEVPNILNIPPELLELILKRIKWKEVISLETLCKKFSLAVRRAVTELHHRRNDTELIEAEKIVTKYPNLLDLAVNCPENGFDLCLDKLARLTRLKIYNLHANQICLGRLSSTLQHLKIDNESPKMATALFEEISSLTKLTHLSFTRMDHQSLQSLAELTDLRELVSLKVDYLSGPSYSWKTLPIVLLTNIRQLTISNSVVQCTLDAVCQMSQLTALKIASMYDQKREVTIKISCLTRLESLEVEYFRRLLPEFGQLTRLTRLAASFDKDSADVLTKFQRLKTLWISNSQGEDLTAYISQLPYLERVIQFGAPMSCNFDKLTACSNLTSLRVSCSLLNVVPEVASEIQLQMYQRIAKLTTLKKLATYYYDNIEPLLVLTNLRSLQVYSNYRVTPIEELAPINRLPNLEKFYFETLDTELVAPDVKQILFSDRNEGGIILLPGK